MSLSYLNLNRGVERNDLPDMDPKDPVGALTQRGDLVVVIPQTGVSSAGTSSKHPNFMRLK